MEGTNSICVLSQEEIRMIPMERIITYARIVANYRTQKKDPNRARITAGGSLLQYPGELTTRTADLTTTSKILWDSVLNTKDAKFMGIDMKNFYLGNPLDWYKYMRMPLALFPEHTIKQYSLNKQAQNGFVYLEIRKAIYGLAQSGALANKLLRKCLKTHGYK